MKKLIVALAIALLAPLAMAQTYSFNIGAVSDYRYRGISQSRLKPALQGGIDLALPSGFYVGAWGSTIRWIKDIERAGGLPGDNELELDFYGGYKGEIGKGLGFDVGLLGYLYPSNNLTPSTNTTELYGALTSGPFTLKYSHSLGNLFGFPRSGNSGYVDASASFELAGFTVVPHLGYQKVSGNGSFSYTDYSLTVSKEWVSLLWSVALVGADTKTIGGVPAYVSRANGKDLGKAGVVLGVKKTF